MVLLEELFERRPAVRVDVCGFGVRDRSGRSDDLSPVHCAVALHHQAGDVEE